jgi:ATP-dependent Clp protease ATP-binding subunit ClpA
VPLQRALRVVHAGIPVSKLQQTDREKLLHLREELHKRVVGQDAAVDVVASAVLRSRAGLAARNRCAAVKHSFGFLFDTLYLLAVRMVRLGVLVWLQRWC